MRGQNKPQARPQEHGAKVEKQAVIRMLYDFQTQIQAKTHRASQDQRAKDSPQGVQQHVGKIGLAGHEHFRESTKAKPYKNRDSTSSRATMARIVVVKGRLARYSHKTSTVAAGAVAELRAPSRIATPGLRVHIQTSPATNAMEKRPSQKEDADKLHAVFFEYVSFKLAANHKTDQGESYMNDGRKCIQDRAGENMQPGLPEYQTNHNEGDHVRDTEPVRKATGRQGRNEKSAEKKDDIHNTPDKLFPKVLSDYPILCGIKIFYKGF